MSVTPSDDAELCARFRLRSSSSSSSETSLAKVRRSSAVEPSTRIRTRSASHEPLRRRCKVAAASSGPDDECSVVRAAVVVPPPMLRLGMTNALVPTPSCSLAVSRSDFVDENGKDDDAALPSVLVVLETLVLLIAAVALPPPPPRVRAPVLPRLTVCPSVPDRNSVGAVAAGTALSAR